MKKTKSAADVLRKKIDDGTALVGVIGQGYVGLPLSLVTVEQGMSVLGFDIDPVKVEALESGASYIRHIEKERVEEAVESGRFEATSDFDRLGEPDVILICVPTPLDVHYQPDLRFVEQTGEQVARSLRPGQLVVLESTTYPGTTDEVLKSTLDRSGLTCGEDYFLAFSPEREDPGNPTWTTSKIPKVVGGVDSTSGDLAEALYARIVDEVVRVPSARAAEATKITENVFRAVNIALVNELKVIFARMGIDVWEVLDAAETKPFGFTRFDPGPGLGGHCIPIDPFYLSWKAREHGVVTRFIELAGEINTGMPAYVVNHVATALNADQLPMKGSRVLVVGLAYKPDVDDIRESPSFVLMDMLANRGAEVEYYDPYVPRIGETREHGRWEGLESVAWDAETIESFDVVLVSTHHRAIDWESLGAWAARIVDTRNVMAGTSVDPAKVWKA